MAKGLCSRGHDIAALAASRRVPLARARPPTCAPRVTIGLKATPEYECGSSHSAPEKMGPTVAFGRGSRTARTRCQPFFPATSFHR